MPAPKQLTVGKTYTLDELVPTVCEPPWHVWLIDPTVYLCGLKCSSTDTHEPLSNPMGRRICLVCRTIYKKMTGRNMP